jgi:ComEC/Rec2-related protein
MSGKGRSSPCSALRSPLILIALSFATGIALADSITTGLNQWYVLLALSLLIWIRWEKAVTFLVLVFVSGGLLHLLKINAQNSAPFFEQLSNGPIHVTMEGVIDSPPERAGKPATRTRFDFRIENITRKDDKKTAYKTRIRVEINGLPPTAYGDRLRLQGILKRPNPKRNPASFDYTDFLRNQGIHAEFSCHEKDVKKLGTDKGNPVIAAGLHCRGWISEQITRGLGENETEAIAIIKAMALGQRSDSPDYLTDKFRFSGTLHVFAVSGLHVGIVAAIVWFGMSALTGLFGLHRNVAVLSVILAVIAYAIITGLRPSAFRAAVMAVIFFGGMLFGREPRVFNSTAAAAMVILLCDTNQLFRPGFQLSFCVLISILAFANPIGKYLYHPFRPDPFLPKSLITPGRRAFNSVSRKIIGLMAMSIASWAGSSLLTWYFFGLITPVSILANLMLIPLAFLVLGTAALSVLLAPIGHPLPAEIVNESNALWAKTAAFSASKFSNIPGAHWAIASPAHLFRDECEVNLPDLPYGGGACHIAMRGEEDWLIDSGSEASFKRAVHPLLRSYGSGQLAGMILSHGDIGHVGGASTGIEEYQPRRLITTPLKSTSPAWRSALLKAKEHGIQSEFPSTGEQIHLGNGYHLHILFPPAENAPGLVADDRCLITQLRTPEGWRILFMADSGFYTERWLMKHIRPEELRSDIMVQGQHNTDHYGLPGFIDAVAPRAVIVSAPYRPRSRESRHRMKAFIHSQEIELFEQAKTGAISIRFDAEHAYIKAFLGNQSLTLKRAD